MTRLILLLFFAASALLCGLMHFHVIPNVLGATAGVFGVIATLAVVWILANGYFDESRDQA